MEEQSKPKGCGSLKGIYNAKQLKLTYTNLDDNFYKDKRTRVDEMIDAEKVKVSEVELVPKAQCSLVFLCDRKIFRCLSSNNWSHSYLREGLKTSPDTGQTHGPYTKIG